MPVKSVGLPARSPNLNAYAERFVLSIKSECLDRLVLLGERHLRRAIGEYVEHYRFERTHLVMPVKSVGLPARSPNLSAYAERFVLSIKSECLDRLVLLGERHLRRAIGEYVEHYRFERTHQGLGNRLIDGVPECSTGRVKRRERLGGLLNSYYREAA